VPAVRRVNDCLQPTWDDTEWLLLRLPDSLGTQVSLEVGDDHWLIVEHVGNVGYFVCGSVPTEHDYFNLIDSRLGDTITEGDLALERTTFPRYALVGQEIMLLAAKTFFESGERNQGCEWVPEKDAFY
jgi:hypothetical protein